MAEVVSYGVANGTAKTDGVVLDIEPPEPQSAAAFQALLTQHQRFVRHCQHDMALSIAIRFFWDTPVEFPAGSGITKKAHEYVLDPATRSYCVLSTAPERHYGLPHFRLERLRYQRRHRLPDQDEINTMLTPTAPPWGFMI